MRMSLRSFASGFAFVSTLMVAGFAGAQFLGEIGAGRFVGNPSASQATPTDASLTAMFDRALCTTGNASIVRLAGTWSCLASANNAIWATNGSGVPSLSGTLPFTLPVAQGGTGAVTLTGILQGNGTSAVTAITNSSTVGQVLRVTGASTYAWGAVDLTNANAVTGALPINRGGTNCSAASGTCVDNISGFSSTGIMSRTGAGTYTFSSLSTLLDVIGSTRGSIIYRGAGGWAALTPGAATTVLTSNGAGADPSYTTAGTGTVTNVATADLLTGGPITTTGTVSMNFAITPQGRLTLTTLAPVMTSSVTAGTSVFYTPYFGNIIAIYNGTRFVPGAFSELSIALGSNWAANTNYDAYVGNDSGTVRLCTGAAWTNSTTRNESLTRISGLLTNNASMTCRYNNTTTFTCAQNQCTYVGTFRTTAAGQVDFIFGGAASGGTAAVLNVWNMYNRRPISASSQDTGTSYTYSSGTIRQKRASAGNQVTFLRGQNEDAIMVSSTQSVLAPANGGGGAWGIGVDSTTVFHKLQSSTNGPDGANNLLTGNSNVHTVENIGIGSHFVAALEASDGSTSQTFNFVNNSSLDFHMEM